MSCIGHVTKCTMVAATSAGTAARARDLVKDVVLVVPDRLGREKVGKLVAARVLIGPIFHSFEHVSLNLDMVVASSRMVECPEDIVNDLVHRNTSVLPGIQNSWDCVLKNGGGDTTSTRVEDVCEMILGQHGVSRIGARRVVPRLILRLGAGSDDTRRTVLEDLGHLLNDGSDEGSEKTQNESSKSLTDVESAAEIRGESPESRL
jgi:hypothetical protein